MGAPYGARDGGGGEASAGYGNRTTAFVAPPTSAEGEYGELVLAPQSIRTEQDLMGMVETTTMPAAVPTPMPEVVASPGYAEREQGESYATRQPVNQPPPTQVATPVAATGYAGRAAAPVVAAGYGGQTSDALQQQQQQPPLTATHQQPPVTAAGYGQRQHPATAALAAPATRPRTRSGARIQCPHCPFVADDPASLRDHAAAAHTVSLSPSLCAFCGKVYPSPRDLSIHMEKRHGGGAGAPVASASTGTGTIECQFCERRFHDQASVWDHVAARHRI